MEVVVLTLDTEEVEEVNISRTCSEDTVNNCITLQEVVYEQWV